MQCREEDRGRDAERRDVEKRTEVGMEAMDSVEKRTGVKMEAERM